MTIKATFIGRSILLCSALISLNLAAETLKVASPDGNIVFHVSDDNGLPGYWIDFRSKEVISPSALGLEFKGVEGFVRDLKITDHKKTQQDSTWE